MVEYIVGIDEAGRGPLIGDMVVAGVMLNKSFIKDVSDEVKIKDSKLMDPDERFNSFKSVMSKPISFFIDFLPPASIDRENINLLTAQSVVRIIRFFSLLINRERSYFIEIYVDEVKGIHKIIEKECRNIFEKNFSLKIEPEADSKYPVVSLASILAKVSRDVNISASRAIAGDFGSGYPADSRTRDWLKTVFNGYTKPPFFIRRSWSILKNEAPEWFIEKRKKSKTLWDFIGVKG
ncbi:MAG: ribonuclease HII [Thermosphaera sp.]